MKFEVLFPHLEPVRGLVADWALQLLAQHSVLVPQHEQLGVLGGVAAQQHRRSGQQLPGHLVQQRNDQAEMVPGLTGRVAVLACSDDFSSPTGFAADTSLDFFNELVA
ncbi:hypothetical protein ACFCYB_11350 [Streptomyces sp. NPDC056309]|uniref:hypothetical protein n=1 Tax=unclassified Streptomyces TaxID=2593676 RepID=UPI0035E2CB1C